MKMKKPLALMLAAGILSAGLASCVVSGDNDPIDTAAKTEPPFTQSSTQGPNTPVVPSTDPSQVIYSNVNEPAYIIRDNASLKSVADPTQSISLGMLTELTRIGKHSVWSKVTYQGAEYYIASSALTTDDILEKSFTACDKTMYVNVNSVNVRKYPSAPASSSETDYFSTILASISHDTEVKVIAQGTSWSKVQVSDGGKTVTGFINSSYLSTTKSNATEADYLRYFTSLEAPVTMYVVTDTANLRQHPYTDDRGTLMPGVTSGLLKGTEVTVIAEGTVENHVWCMITWTESAGAAPRKGYISKSCLSRTQVGVKATLEDMLNAYPDLVEFDSKKPLYATSSLFGRSQPSFVKTSSDKDENIIKWLEKKDEVIAVAYGTLETTDEDGSKFDMTWVLVEDQAVGYYFVAYRYLTPNSDGSPAQLPVSLEEMLDLYGFTAISGTLNIKTTAVIKAYTVPNSEIDAAKDIPADSTLTVKAQGTTGDQFLSIKWYIVEYDGALYFIVNNSANFDIV